MAGSQLATLNKLYTLKYLQNFSTVANIYKLLQKLTSSAAKLTHFSWTVYPMCYRRSKKAYENAISHPQDHLERSLRPIQETQVTPGPFWTRQKKLKASRTSNKKLRLDTYFPLKEPQNSLSLWNGCVRLYVRFPVLGSYIKWDSWTNNRRQYLL